MIFWGVKGLSAHRPKAEGRPSAVNHRPSSCQQYANYDTLPQRHPGAAFSPLLSVYLATLLAKPVGCEAGVSSARPRAAGLHACAWPRGLDRSLPVARATPPTPTRPRSILHTPFSCPIQLTTLPTRVLAPAVASWMSSCPKIANWTSKFFINISLLCEPLLLTDGPILIFLTLVVHFRLLCLTYNLCATVDLFFVVQGMLTLALAYLLRVVGECVQSSKSFW